MDNRDEPPLEPVNLQSCTGDILGHNADIGLSLRGKAMDFIWHSVLTRQGSWGRSDYVLLAYTGQDHRIGD